MPESKITLSELNLMVRNALQDAFPDTIWVVAEIAEQKQNQTGHCYLELIEKDEQTDRVTARARATIWASLWRMLKPYFESVTGRPLSAGIKVLVQASVEFHEVYGFSLNIRDIDPTYTIGDLSRKRAETISRLKKEGVFEMNRELSMSLAPRNIAVISSPTAAGLGDFVDQLEKNEYGFQYTLRLFPAVMQGENAEQSIRTAMDQVYSFDGFFDVLVLIRGGGATTDLGCFDSYELAYYITQLPIPVITGIGHERDESVADLVANVRVKTPTAAAEFLIGRSLSFLRRIDESQQRFTKTVQSRLSFERMRNSRIVAGLRPMVARMLQSRQHQLEINQSRCVSLVSALLAGHKNLLQQKSNQLNQQTGMVLLQAKNRLQVDRIRLKTAYRSLLNGEMLKLHNLEKANRLVSPVNVLRRGYSITVQNGKAIKNSDQVESGTSIRTILSSGEIISVVEKLKKQKKSL